MKAFKIITVATIMATMASCATPPDKIKASAYPDAAYAGRPCDVLVAEEKRASTELAALSKKQRDAATADAIGVFAVGIPVSSLTGGDKETEISVLKGKVEALKRAMKSGGC